MYRLSRTVFPVLLGVAPLVGECAVAKVPSSFEVYVNQNGSCTVQSQVVPCNNVGERLAGAHVSLSATIVVGGSRLATFEMFGAALRSLQHAGFINVRFPSN
jgi:biopolymer transport protein ExbD